MGFAGIDPRGERRAGGAVKHDISVPIPALGPYLAEAGAAWPPTIRR